MRCNFSTIALEIERFGLKGSFDTISKSSAHSSCQIVCENVLKVFGLLLKYRKEQVINVQNNKIYVSTDKIYRFKHVDSALVSFFQE